MVMNLFKDDLEENGGFYSPDDALAGFSTFIDIITNYGKFSESKSFKSILELMSNSFPFMDEQYLKHKDTISNDIANNVSSDYEKVIPMGRAGKLDEVADLICYLLSDRASYISGTTINISGAKSTR